MSQMLIAYARTGDPNGESKDPTQDGKLPFWPAYDLKNRSTMIWDQALKRGPHIENDPRGAERVFADKSHYHQAGTPLP
jgi:carboxylesterase type B